MLTQRPMNAIDARCFCWHHIFSSWCDFEYAINGGTLVVTMMREHLGDWELPTMIGNAEDILYYAQDVRGRSLSPYNCKDCGDKVCHGYVVRWETFEAEVLNEYDANEMREFVIC